MQNVVFYDPKNTAHSLLYMQIKNAYLQWWQDFYIFL